MNNKPVHFGLAPRITFQPAWCYTGLTVVGGYVDVPCFHSDDPDALRRYAKHIIDAADALEAQDETVVLPLPS